MVIGTNKVMIACSEYIVLQFETRIKVVICFNLNILCFSSEKLIAMFFFAHDFLNHCTYRTVFVVFFSIFLILLLLLLLLFFF